MKLAKVSPSSGYQAGVRLCGAWGMYPISISIGGPAMLKCCNIQLHFSFIYGQWS